MTVINPPDALSKVCHSITCPVNVSIKLTEKLRGFALLYKRKCCKYDFRCLVRGCFFCGHLCRDRLLMWFCLNMKSVERQKCPSHGRKLRWAEQCLRERETFLIKGFHLLLLVLKAHTVRHHLLFQSTSAISLTSPTTNMALSFEPISQRSRKTVLSAVYILLFKFHFECNDW